MKNTWKISDNIHLLLPELNQHQLSMLRRMIGECLPEKKEHEHNTSWEAGYTDAITKIEDSLKAKGLLNE